MRLPPVLLLAIAACWHEAPPPASPPPASPPTQAPTAPYTPPPRALRDITGPWRESFDGRGGCSDVTTIEGRGRDLSAHGADCTDGAPYVFDDLLYDGEQLSLQLTVPQTGYVVRYRLTWSGSDELDGEAEVSGGGSAEHYHVHWTRER